MKKTITITIGKMLFHLEEDAYEALSDYLDSVRAHFASYPEGDEIAGDIENRIAEHFLKDRPEKDKAITLNEVEALVASMGRPEDFAEAEGENARAEETRVPKGKHKLYRDTDNALIAGVASGLGSYFAIDPVIIRLLFIITAFFDGFGILAYLVLWIIVKEAKTPTEKLQMKGTPVTLQSVDRVMKSTAKNINSGKIRSVFQTIIEGISKVFEFIFRKAAPFFVKFIGVILTVVSILAIFGLIFASAIVVFNIDSPYLDFPLRDAVDTAPSLFYTALAACFTVALIPLVFIFNLGAILAKGRTSCKGRLAIGLLGVWFIALITLGVSATKIVPRYEELISNNPAYAPSTKNFEFRDFSKISAEDGLNLELSEGDDFSVTAEGRVRDIDGLEISTEEGVLLIGRDQEKRFICIFCDPKSVTVRITAPKIESLTGKNGVRMTASKLNTQTLTLALSNGSYAEIGLATSTDNLAVTLRNMSSAEFSGTSKQALIRIENGSRFEAEDLVIAEAEIRAENGSSADINVTDKLKAVAENGSSIEYLGSPALDYSERNGSRIRAY